MRLGNVLPNFVNRQEFAKIIGVSNSRVSNWEQGINRPDADMFGKLCNALQVSPSLLLGLKLTKDELSEKEWKVIFMKEKELVGM